MKVCRAAERIKLSTVDIADRWPFQRLYEFISETYSNKVIADAIDDKEHQKRQTLPEYFGTMY
jgi:hypothetical protein